MTTLDILLLALAFGAVALDHVAQRGGDPVPSTDVPSELCRWVVESIHLWLRCRPG